MTPSISPYYSPLTIKKMALPFIISLAIIAVIMFLRGDNVFYFLLIFPALILLFVGIYFFGRQKTKRIEELLVRGKFLPGQSYQREEYIDFFDPQDLWAFIRKKSGKRLLAPVVNYPVSKNQTLPLRADKGYPPEFLDAHPKIDLLIDEEDYNNYYLDFEIKKTTATADIDQQPE